jgi:lipopolysaccharide transport system ATP-binding protein
MLVRLAFAVQVQVQPDILIVDEALAVGDALFQKRCFERIEKLLGDGVTLIFVSHEQESVRTLTRRSLLLKNGAPVVCGNSSDVLLAYRKQLHEEESSYFREIAQRVRSSAGVPTPAAATAAGSMADKRSFGEGGARVEAVQLFGAEGEPSAMFHPGEPVRIRISCVVDVDIENLNVGVRIRSKEGIKIYSWGTLNQDMITLRTGSDAPVFWRRSFRRGDRFDVWLECECTLGQNLYEIQTSISHEARPDYEAQRILHWVDEAAFFQVVMRRNEYFFGGFVDLRMRATWQEAT